MCGLSLNKVFNFAREKKSSRKNLFFPHSEERERERESRESWLYLQHWSCYTPLTICHVSHSLECVTQFSQSTLTLCASLSLLVSFLPQRNGSWKKGAHVSGSLFTIQSSLTLPLLLFLVPVCASTSSYDAKSRLEREREKEEEKKSGEGELSLIKKRACHRSTRILYLFIWVCDSLLWCSLASCLLLCLLHFLLAL